MEAEHLRRFPPVFSSMAEISRQQLGWRIAVLPFRSEGGAAGYSIALGMAEEISATFSLYRSPRLIAPITFWDGAGPADDFLGRCRLYKLDYVVEGTIQVVDGDVRVLVTISDVVLDFEVIWSGSFDGQMDDLYALQECIAATTVAQLDPDLMKRALPPALATRAQIPAAHHAVLAAMHWIVQLNRAKFMRARELLAKAVELDPNYAAAHTWIAYWSIIAVSLGWIGDPQGATTAAGASAERAMDLDPGNARALAIAGHVRSYLFHDVSTAVRLHARAVDLDPNLAIVWALSSWSKVYSGMHSTAIKHALAAQALSPRDPHIFFSQHAMIASYMFSGQLTEAEMLCDIVLAKNSEHAAALRICLGVLGHAGRVEEAADCLAKLRELGSMISIGAIAGRAPFGARDKACYIEGLRLAGVEE